jgi:hypothetical protein
LKTEQSGAAAMLSDKDFADRVLVTFGSGEIW